MPKAKPDQVVVHRIELQSHEREALDTFVMANALNKTLVPILEMIVQIAKSPFAVLTLTAWISKIINDEMDSVERQIANDPAAVPTTSLIGGFLWNATAPGILWDAAEGDGLGGALQERVAYAREGAARLMAWAETYSGTASGREDLV